MKTFGLFAMLIVMALYPVQSFACAVAIIPFEDTLNQQDSIAIGTITHITDQAITFQIDEYLKGTETSPTLVAYQHDDQLSLVQAQRQPDPSHPQAIKIAPCSARLASKPDWKEGFRYLIMIPTPPSNGQISPGDEQIETLTVSFQSTKDTQPVWLKPIIDDSIAVQNQNWEWENLSLEEVRSIIETETGAPARKPAALPTGQPQYNLLPWIGVVALILGGIMIGAWRRQQAA